MLRWWCKASCNISDLSRSWKWVSQLQYNQLQKYVAWYWRFFSLVIKTKSKTDPETKVTPVALVRYHAVYVTWSHVASHVVSWPDVLVTERPFCWIASSVNRLWVTSWPRRSPFNGQRLTAGQRARWLTDGRDPRAAHVTGRVWFPRSQLASSKRTVFGHSSPMFQQVSYQT